MSVHTIISSKITDFRSLADLLTELGLPWQEVSGVRYKFGGRAAYRSVSVDLAGETVLMVQANPGKPFVMQSQGWWFRDRAAAKQLASLGSAAVVRARRQEQDRLDPERQRAADAARAAETQRRAAERAERQRLADEAAEGRRQADLDDDVARRLAEHEQARREQLDALNARRDSARKAAEQQRAAAEVQADGSESR